MNLISRYIIRQMAVMAVYALLAFLALYSFFEIINEVGDLGKGSYNGATMAQYVLMQMPARAYELMPLAVLIGGLVSLSQLAAGSELTVIKASGMSTKKLLLVLSQFGLIFALATVALGEWVAPTMSQKAENIKAAAINGKISTGNTGLWLKEKNSIINVREMLPDHTLLGIKIWERNDKNELTQAAEAESAVLNPDGSWQLKNIRRSILGEDKVEVSTAAEENWPIAVKRMVAQAGVSRSRMGDGACCLRLYTANHAPRQYGLETLRRYLPRFAVPLCRTALRLYQPVVRRAAIFGRCLADGFVCTVGGVSDTPSGKKIRQNKLQAV